MPCELPFLNGPLNRTSHQMVDFPARMVKYSCGGQLRDVEWDLQKPWFGQRFKNIFGYIWHMLGPWGPFFLELEDGRIEIYSNLRTNPGVSPRWAAVCHDSQIRGPLSQGGHNHGPSKACPLRFFRWIKHGPENPPATVRFSQLETYIVVGYFQLQPLITRVLDHIQSSTDRD